MNEEAESANTKYTCLVLGVPFTKSLLVSWGLLASINSILSFCKMCTTKWQINDDDDDDDDENTKTTIFLSVGGY